jgi:hypothetical protein
VLIRVTAAAEVLLEDPAEFRRFSIRFDPGARDAAGEAALARVARPDGDAAWVSEAWLRAQAGGDAAWNDGFARMLDFARGRGWVDGAGGIRAHIEPG